MGNDNTTFVAHLSFLNQLPESAVTSMCHTILENQAWPEVEGELLDPVSLIVFAMSGLAQRLAPDIPVEEHVEINVLGGCLGMILTERDVAVVAANVEAAEIGLAGDLGLMITEDEDGETEGP